MNFSNSSASAGHAVYQDLVQRLKAAHRHEDAAIILLNFANTVEDAIVALCEAKKWHQAWFTANQNKRLDIIGKKPEICFKSQKT